MDNNKCSCCNNEDAEEYHICPYKYDINNDADTLCNCCDNCEYQCRMGI